MTAEEMTEQLRNLRPEQFARLVQVLPELKKPQKGERPALPRRTIWTPPTGEPLEIWGVDWPGWSAAGAVDHPPTDEDLAAWNPPKKAEKVASGPPAASALEALREEFKAVFPDERVPPRAKADWFRERLESKADAAASGGGEK